MAKIMLSNCQDKAYSLLGLFCLMLLMQKSDATDFQVGGASGWRVPRDPSTNLYNQWAQRNRFQIGDSLVFVYQANQDSVLRVTKENYDSCNTNSPLEKFSDGHTSYKFNKSGHYYFISGNKDNCHKNEKIWVIVMAERGKSADQVYSPPPAPTGGLAPSPPPAPLESPPPASEPPSAGSLVYLSCVSTFAAFIASFLVLVC